MFDALLRINSEVRPVSLNIENEETYRLADELARLTGESLTGAVTVALKERLQREKRQRDADAETRAQKLRAIADRCASLLQDGPSAVEHGDFLYGPDGLPR